MLRLLIVFLPTPFLPAENGWVTQAVATVDAKQQLRTGTQFPAKNLREICVYDINPMSFSNIGLSGGQV
ncbi:hypothetical protein IMPR6_20145 [Imperialibacter sp. EC-SDR9]|nr:hypothetical protein IMPR6_20145 [Imperialibacter sp. EC-SDR9]